MRWWYENEEEMKSCEHCSHEDCKNIGGTWYCLECPECGVNWKDRKMEFDKSRVFSSVNADELKAGDKVIVAYNLYGIKEQVKMFTESAIDVIEVIQDEDYFNRFKIKHGESFPLAYLVERAENCTNCGSHEVCGYVQNISKFACFNRCENWKPKAEQKAEKMNESGELDWGMNCCMVCDFYNKDNHRCLVDRDEVLNPSLNTCQYYTPRSPKKCEDCVYHYYEDKFDSICRCNMNDRPTTPTQAKTCEYFLREEVEPHYRPFRDTDELVKVWCEKGGKWQKRELTRPLIWVHRDDTYEECLIVTFDNDSVYLGHRSVSLHELWEHFTFLDGSVCGVEE